MSYFVYDQYASKNYPKQKRAFFSIGAGVSQAVA